MNDKTAIKTTKTVYPQIYAYIIPKYQPNEGWVKIGYTDQKDVNVRIAQQTQTASITPVKLWSGPAKYEHEDSWFRDKQLHAYLRKHKNVEQRKGTEWFYYNGYLDRSYTDYEEFRNGDLSQVSKELEYTLRAEQEDAVQMTLKYVESHPGGEFLWNAKPRFGKTLTAYDLARRMKAQRVLVVTNRPAIANSWYDDFERFIAWQTNYEFVSTAFSLKERTVLTREQFIKLKPNDAGEERDLISFISLQDLKGSLHFGGTYKKLSWVKDLKWDLLIIDEAHEGVDTFKTDLAFNNITRNFTLHLSGTPFKAVVSGRFAEEQIYNWSYAEEQDAKENWPVEEVDNNPYEGLPRLSLFSYQMSRMITDEVNKGAEIDGKEIDYAFDLNEFFATNDSGKFIHEAEVVKWLDTLTKNEKYPFSTQTLRNELKHTLWLLNRVASAKALEKILKEHPVFEHYGIVLAAGDGRTEDDQIINQQSLDRVRDAIEEHERTITLSVGQLTTGVTIPEWTAVLMLSNIQSASLYMQAAFRAQNPWDFEIDGKLRRKENSYVFDFAPERTLIIYDEFANNLISKTADGGGTTQDREQNIETLLNFFPVIAEDDEGKMIELDVRQVLTIPKTIKAQEVVKRGFMSNFLFQNISGIFASEKARAILEQLNPVPVGKVTPQKTEVKIDTKNVTVDSDGNALVDNEIVIAETDARFGNKVYAEVMENAITAADNPSANLGALVANSFTQKILDTAKEFAKENKVTVAQAEFIVRQNASIIAREVEEIKEQVKIEKNEAKDVYERVIAESFNNPSMVAEAEANFISRTTEIEEAFKENLTKTIETKTPELTQKSVEAILQKSEEKKKYDVEDDIRSRLRGFARTIPSFLMGYGTTDTTLNNFEKNLSDSVFKEVTGITIDQFIALRDEFNFFNKVVFDESIQEFLRKRNELADYFDESQLEDIFDYIPPQQTNQIFTPKWVVKLMIDKMEEENPDLFKDKDRTFADLYVKSGLYLTEIVKRLFKGLEQSIPNDEERLKHILENQIYGFAPSEIIYNIANNFVFSQFNDISDKNLVHQDLTEIAKAGESINMKFDVVVGNPPYQEEMKNTSDMPIYPYFYDLAKAIAGKYCLISPARFLFNAGKTSKQWNNEMLEDRNIKVLYYELNSEKIFPSTDIKGGITIIYRDRTIDYGAIKVFTALEELEKILQKVLDENFQTINTLIFAPESYRLSKRFHELHPNAHNKLSKGHLFDLTTNIFSRLNEYFFDKQPQSEDEYIQIYGRQNGNRLYKWLNREYIEQHDNLDSWKVFVPKSNGSGAIGEVPMTPVIGQPILGKPREGHTQTFISIGVFKTKYEAESLLKYVKTKFARTMVGTLKITQDNKKDVWVNTPLQDFTPQSDIDWTKSIPEIDQQLYAKYGLDEKEITFIEEKVKAME